MAKPIPVIMAEKVFLPSAFELTDLDKARAVQAEVRAKHGFAREPADLLTWQEAQPKFSKTPWPMLGLSLLPNTMFDEGVNLCPNATPDCIKFCLNEAGRGGMSEAQRARAWRTDLFLWNPREFYTLLWHQLERAERVYGEGFLFRPNVYSDVKWESLLPDEWWERFAHVRVMDYTKRWRRPEFPRPNYRLAYSAAAHTKFDQFKTRLASGANVAVVFDHPKDVPFPSQWKEFPLVDGDEHDNLWERPKGVILGLRAKGKLKKADSPFKRKLSPNA